MGNVNNVDCSFFRKIVEIEHFVLRAAILDKWQNVLRGRGQFGRKRFKPRCLPPGTYETKIAVRTAERSILTILRKK